MAVSEVATQSRAPWSFRILEALPLSPVAVGIGLAATLTAVYFGVEYASGQLGRVLAGEAPDHIAGHFRSAPINAVLVAYLLVAPFYLARWTRRNLADLQPMLRTPEAALDRDPTGPLASRRGKLAGMIGALAAAAFFLLPRVGTEFLNPEYWIFEHVWDNGIAIVIGWLVGRFLYTLVDDSIYVSRLASQLASIDLLDLGPVSPFARQGLRSALLAVILVSILATNLGNAVISAAAMAIAICSMLIVATLALVLPARGVHRRIQQAKRAKLAALRARIRAGDQALVERSSEPDRLPGLLALEARIQAVHEWPFDTSSLLRFAFYLLIGLGSWLGAAAVERLLDRILA
jgi:hypothetical protein